MNGPPDWQDGECCFRCRTQFTLVARKHHCRNCGNIFCAKCSSQQIPLPKLNIEKNVRVCDTCYEKVTGRKEDPLTLALGSKDSESKKEQQSKQQSQTTPKNLGNKSSANASAPSEQDLKEEEELQLALALSLSETPKVSFPDYRHLEETVNTASNKVNSSISSNHASTNPTDAKSSGSSGNKSSYNSNHQNVSSTDITAIQALPVQNSSITQAAITYPATMASPVSVNKQQHVSQVQQPAPLEYQVQERDQELFRFIAEVHGTLEVFNNRLEACKLRNRPISRDAAIPSLFIKLNSEIQPKLSSYIKTYEEEREGCERLQDKLSQIADARAALDALREEHKDKLRQLAAEAEKQRQSQLATKLEAMRKMKTQMMQYQRELALQRIREQEMMYQPQQHSSNDYPSQTSVGQLPYQQPFTEQQSYEHILNQQQQISQGQYQTSQAQVPTQAHSLSKEQHWSQQINASPASHQSYIPAYQAASAYPPQSHQTSSHLPEHQSYMPSGPPTTVTQSHQPVIDSAAIAQLEKKFVPDLKPDEETPLISFDD